MNTTTRAVKQSDIWDTPAVMSTPNILTPTIINVMSTAMGIMDISIPGRRGTVDEWFVMGKYVIMLKFRKCET